MKNLYLTSLLIFGFYFNSIALDLYLKTSFFQVGSQQISRTLISQDTIDQLIVAPLFVDINSSLFIQIHNLDGVSHQIGWNDSPAAVVVPAFGQITLFQIFSEVKVYLLISNDFMAQSLGASFAFVSGVPVSKRFYWNLWEMQSSTTISIANQSITTFPNPYRPDVFTINGYDYPLNMNDSLGIVHANVGDSIYIAVVNSGSMVHSLHFHGFHFKILSSTKNQSYVNWIKDSAPIFPQDGIILLLVPDKPGMYPIHDHNLTAVTTSGGYAGGMMTMMDIEP